MNKTILVIEDEKSLSSAIESSLIKSDFSVLMANKVDDAIELLTSNPKVDAVWLDHYLLGNKNGLDFMHELKANKKWNNIPVFVVTNSVSDEKVDTYEVLGIEKYFVKSNNSLNDIIDTIKASIL
jgi:two-component system chemotaxis response regulator CheY